MATDRKVGTVEFVAFITDELNARELVLSILRTAIKEKAKAIQNSRP
jgi:hypothetical protein